MLEQADGGQPLTASPVHHLEAGCKAAQVAVLQHPEHLVRVHDAVGGKVAVERVFADQNALTVVDFALQPRAVLEICGDVAAGDADDGFHVRGLRGADVLCVGRSSWDAPLE